MTLHCPFCTTALGVYPEGALIEEQICMGCGRRLDVAAIMAALGFPLLGADERWRSETCGTCAFAGGVNRHECRAHPPNMIENMGEAGDAHCYPHICTGTPACAEWAERRGE